MRVHSSVRVKDSCRFMFPTKSVVYTQKRLRGKRERLGFGACRRLQKQKKKGVIIGVDKGLEVAGWFRSET